MKSKSHKRHNSHHPRPSSACGFRYVDIGAGLSSEFPISYLWNSDLEPASHPIVEMISMDCVEVGYCHSGSGVLAVENRVIPFAAGDISLIGNREMRMSRSENGKQSFWSYFWFDYDLLLAGMADAAEIAGHNPFKTKKFPYIFTPRKNKKLCRVVQEIVAELKDRADGHRVIVKHLVYVLVTLLHRICRNMPAKESSTAPIGIPRIAPALRHIANHYADPIGTEHLATLCHTSTRNFRRMFQATIGKSPLQYVAQLRIRMASAIISESNKPISMIAYEVGFESINTFNRQFRAALGATPSQWRQANR